MNIYKNLTVALAAAIVLAGCSSRQLDESAELPAAADSWQIFAGDTGEALTPGQLLAVMDGVDVIVMGESHTDASGHIIQKEILATAVNRWPMTLSLEEFDRSQQELLDEFSKGDATINDLEADLKFVTPKVRANWRTWSLPKLVTAVDADAPVVASNAPLRYSRMVRNFGCADLPPLEEEELELFECPMADEDSQYKKRFEKRLKSAIRSNKSVELKPLREQQIERMFRAHRVWDATMADSIAMARADSTDKIIHIVGNFHSDFNGGLLQELRVRDPESRVLVISLRPKRSERLLESDLHRADIVIYTRS